MRFRVKISPCSHVYILRNFKIAIYLEDWNFKKKGNEFTFRAKNSL